MAHKDDTLVDDTKQAQTKAAGDQGTDVTVPTAAENTTVETYPPLRSPLFWSIIVGAVVLALIIAAIIVAVVHRDNMARQNTNTFDLSNGSHWQRTDDFGDGYGSYYRISSSTNGPTTSTTVTSYTSTTGVVTNVSENSLTIAGNGASEKIKTNSSTEYVGDKPKVNDSVTVIGTTDSKGAITATQVRVDNY